MKDIPIVTVLENVASMDKATRGYYTNLVGAMPYHINASTFGWCARNRLFWVHNDLKEGQTQRLTSRPAFSWRAARSVPT